MASPLQLKSLPLANASLRSWLQRSTPTQRATWLQSLTDEEAEIAIYSWHDIWARDNQQTPLGDWQIWLLLCGRGFGKTRVGAEWIRDQVDAGKTVGAIVGATAADVRDTMIEGESGILAACPPWNKPIYKSSSRRVEWPNGAYVLCYSAEEPNRIRGGNNQFAWADELAAWRFPDSWDQLMLSLRSGDNPQAVVTTTPRPIPIIKELAKDEFTHITVGSSYENRRNLAKTFFDKIIKKYEGTRLGLQEIEARILDDNPDALFRRGDIEVNRVTTIPELIRIVVGVDPATESNDNADDTGIVVGGLGTDGQGYILDDCTVHGTPNQWGAAAIAAYNKYKADAMVGEVNQGGEMVKFVVNTIDRRVNFQAVRAKRGKQLRAEPVSALYEQKRVHHVGMFGPLEDQMINWVQGDKSPDRLDALVYVVRALMIPDDDEQENVPVPVMFIAGRAKG